MIKRLLRRQDGATMVMVVAFMALAIPLVTVAVSMSGTASVDSRVKTDILKRQYASLGVGEYVRYQLPNADCTSGPDTIIIDGEAVPFTCTPIPSLCSHCVLVEIPSLDERFLICAPKEEALDGAYPSVAEMWPPNHRWVPIEVLGVAPPPGDTVTVRITAIWQDEAVDAPGSGNTSPDGELFPDGSARIRAERAGPGDGRVYHIFFNATSGAGESCSGEVITVSHDQSKIDSVVDSGPPWYDSTQIP